VSQVAEFANTDECECIEVLRKESWKVDQAIQKILARQTQALEAKEAEMTQELERKKADVQKRLDQAAEKVRTSEQNGKLAEMVSLFGTAGGLLRESESRSQASESAAEERYRTLLQENGWDVQKAAQDLCARKSQERRDQELAKSEEEKRKLREAEEERLRKELEERRREEQLKKEENEKIGSLRDCFSMSEEEARILLKKCDWDSEKAVTDYIKMTVCARFDPGANNS